MAREKTASSQSTSGLDDKLRKIKAIAFDVDGVLTDGGMWWGANGEEFKRFSFSDIMGISLARRARVCPCSHLRRGEPSG